MQNLFYGLCLSLALTNFQAVLAQANKTSWLEQEKSVRAAIDGDHIKDASKQAIAILQQFQKNKVEESDPNLEKFFLQDLSDIATNLTDVDDKMNFGKWEYSTASDVWGTHSIPYLFSLRRMFICDAFKRHDFDQSKSKYCQEFNKLFSELEAGPKAKLVNDWLKMEAANNASSLKRSSDKMNRLMERQKQLSEEIKKPHPDLSKFGPVDPKVQAANDQLKKALEQLKSAQSGQH